MKPERIQIFAPTERAWQFGPGLRLELPCKSSREATVLSSCAQHLGDELGARNFVVTTDRNHVVLVTFETESHESLTVREEDLSNRIEALYEIVTAPVAES